MPAERCRVCVNLNGLDQFYQREQEQKRNDRWVAVPYFVLERREALRLNEAQARGLVARIRSLGWRGEIWIETHDGRRIDVSEPVQESGEDTRQPVIATLNNVDWYVVRPIVRPAEGRMWFMSIRVPGFPDSVILYAKEPLAVVQKADDLSYLQFAEKYQRPEPQQQVTPTFDRPRRRPGDIR